MLVFNPRQVVLLSCQGVFDVVGKREEKHDIVPLFWHSPVSSHPPMYCVFVKKGLMAESIIRSSGCFVVNFISHSMKNIFSSALRSSGEFLEKCSFLGLSEVSCKNVDCFRLKEALGWLECEVVDEKLFGDHVMFIGRVLFSELVRDDKRLFYFDDNKFTTTIE